MNTGIRAVDIMSSKLVVASPDMNLVDAAKLMNKYRIGGLLVVKNNKLVGIITERNIMKRVIVKDKKPKQVKVKDIMVRRSKLVTADKFEDVDSIAKKIARHDVTRIPILHQDKLVGIVTNKDVLANSSEHMHIILEQASIKGNDNYPLAQGKCDRCGAKGQLAFKENKFLCEFCL